MPENNYTKPDLRNRIKSQVMAGSDGGKPGQWSARKAQLVAQKYKAQGGGYKGGKSEGQKSLSKWTKQEWTTSDGKPAEREGGTTRYLPKDAWKKLSPGERAATNAKKREGSREGRQFVANTEAAAEARKEANEQQMPTGGVVTAPRTGGPGAPLPAPPPSPMPVSHAPPPAPPAMKTAFANEMMRAFAFAMQRHFFA